MRKIHRVVVNGEEFSAYHGDVLLDAALINGVEIPHDCRSGHCGTCSVRVIDGEVHSNGGTDIVQACQCRIISDVSLEVEDVPEVTSASARVTALTPVAPDVVEVRIEIEQPIEYLAGQYFQIQFRGFPTRCYSPTVPLDRFGDGRSFHLHVRRVPGGRVSSALGSKIGVGHQVKVTGPFGSAYLRPDLTGRLILIATGTGFAPIWSIADAAMHENRDRELVLVVSARSIEAFYMIPALWRLASCPNVTIVPLTDTPQRVSPVIQTGLPTDYVPQLRADDIVHVAGAPPMVDAVRAIAEAAGARCYTDAFVPNVESEDSLLARAMTWLKGAA